MESSLIVLMRESRYWASVSSGRELFQRARHVLEGYFGVDSGYFIYQKTGLWAGMADEAFEVYETWGKMRGQEETLRKEAEGQLKSGIEPLRHVSQQWIRRTQAPPQVAARWEGWGIQSGGSWLLTLGPKPVGMIVLRRSRDTLADDSVLMGLLAGQVSLVMELLRFRRAAEEASQRDSLTGIYNRRGASLQMERMTSENPGHSGTTWVFGIFDVNEFKRINDRHGHPAGDQVLTEVARILSAALRPGDVSGRWGGDEFVVMINTSAANAPCVIQRLQRQVAKELAGVSVSAGWAVWGEDGPDLETLYHVADRRLYQDKSARIPPRV